jgi:hypothetical protein
LKNEVLINTSQEKSPMNLEHFEAMRDDYMNHCLEDEALKKKMREPFLGNGYHNLTDEIIRNQIRFGSLF